MTIANNRGLGIIYGMMKDLIRVSLISILRLFFSGSEEPSV